MEFFLLFFVRLCLSYLREPSNQKDQRITFFSRQRENVAYLLMHSIGSTSNFNMTRRVQRTHKKKTGQCKRYNDTEMRKYNKLNEKSKYKQQQQNNDSKLNP